MSGPGAEATAPAVGVERDELRAVELGVSGAMEVTEPGHRRRLDRLRVDGNHLRRVARRDAEEAARSSEPELAVGRRIGDADRADAEAAALIHEPRVPVVAGVDLGRGGSAG